jgi:beta-aspartyl-dipeptidase (metallo-type)
MLFIRNANVYAPRPLGLRNLLVGGGKILWIGADAELAQLPAALHAAAETLDLNGARLIPGLIDAHVHVTGGAARPVHTGCRPCR